MDDLFAKRLKRDYADIKQAQGVLLDRNLVWSEDFDSIRLALAELLGSSASMGHYAHPAIRKIAQILIATDNDLTI
jgi:hypothetical protein